VAKRLLVIALAANIAACAANSHERVVECDAQSEKGPLGQLRLSPTQLVIVGSAKSNRRLLAVTAREVRGEGASARTAVLFEGGELSYKDVYGCLSEAVWRWNSAKELDPLLNLSVLQCRQIGSPACSPQ